MDREDARRESGLPFCPCLRPYGHDQDGGPSIRSQPPIPPSCRNHSTAHCACHGAIATAATSVSVTPLPPILPQPPPSASQPSTTRLRTRSVCLKLDSGTGGRDGRGGVHRGFVCGAFGERLRHSLGLRLRQKKRQHSCPRLLHCCLVPPLLPYFSPPIVDSIVATIVLLQGRCCGVPSSRRLLDVGL